MSDARICQKHFDNTLTYKTNANLLKQQTKKEKKVLKSAIDDTTINILEQGLNFAITPSRIPFDKIIGNIEEAVPELLDDTAELIRQETASILRKSNTKIQQSFL